MEKSSSIKLKAVLFIIVFLLNTIAGFACAMGLNMCFNSAHHKNIHLSSNSHHKSVDLAEGHPSEKTNKNCCEDEAAKFAKIDKLTPHSSDFSFHPAFFTAFLSTSYHFEVFASNSPALNNKFFVRTHPAGYGSW